MLITEISQKNQRLKSWEEIPKNCALNKEKLEEFNSELEQYRKIIAEITKTGHDELGLVSPELTVKLANLERKITQLAELARLESGKSTFAKIK